MAEIEQEIDFNLSQYLTILSRRRWIVVSVALLVFATSVCYVTFWPPIFRATTVLNIERENGSDGSNTEDRCCQCDLCGGSEKIYGSAGSHRG